MDSNDKRKRIQNLLSFMGLVASISNYDGYEDAEPTVPEEEKLVVEPYDIFDNSDISSSN